jgi:hypothetical protein
MSNINYILTAEIYNFYIDLFVLICNLINFIIYLFLNNITIK